MESASTSGMRESLSASSRRRMVIAPVMGGPEEDQISVKGTQVVGMKLFVNGVAADVSLDSDGLRWTLSEANGGGGSNAANLNPLAVCFPAWAASFASQRALLFSEMLCAERIDRNAAPTSLWSAYTLTAASASQKKLFGLKIDTLKRSNPAKPSEWYPLHLTVESPNEELIEQLLSEISSGIAGTASLRPRRLLVILNPNAGSGAARNNYRNTVQPVFASAGIAAKVVETERAGHARELVLKALLGKSAASSAFNSGRVAGEHMDSIKSEIPVSFSSSSASHAAPPDAPSSPIQNGVLPFDGIIAVGGDGIFHEIMNGVLLARSLAPVAAQPALAQLRLAHVPCGSTDAVACSLNGSRSVFTAAMHVALGDSTALDVLKVSIGNTVRYACCIATYGFMGDVVQESEHHRWLGPLRYDVIGAMKLFHNQSYKCRVSYLVPADADVSVESGGLESRESSGTVCFAQCPVCRAASASRSQLDLLRANSGSTSARSARAVAPQHQHQHEGAGELSLNDKSAKEHGVSSDAPEDQQHAEKEKNATWRVVEGEWMSIMLIVQPCRSDKTPHGMSRYGHLANGRFTLVLVRRCSPFNYLRFLTTMSSSGLMAGQLPGLVEVVDAVACKVEGLGGPESHWNVDGELVQGVNMEAHAQLGALQCFARGVEN